ncbi:hypothetical protein V8C86DRAFT_2446252 [Haematococcus lacustris]
MANPVIPTPDTQDPHPPAEAEGWTQKYKNNTVSVLDLYNQLKQSNALRDTYRLKLDVTRKVVLLVCLLCGANLACCNLSHAQSQHDKHCKQRPAAEQPPPLPNPTGKQPSSGVWFFDCYPLDRGAKKDARFYADMHNEMANKVQLISKVLGDCGKIRNALNCAQMTKYNKIQAVATHCATRFAILYLICVDLKRSQDALVMMVHSGEWETLRTASTNAAVFEELKSRGQQQARSSGRPLHAAIG